MPKGVYTRKPRNGANSKKASDVAPKVNPATGKRRGRPPGSGKKAAAKMFATAAKTKRGKRSVGFTISNDLSPLNQFQIIRDNIQTLASVRSQVEGTEAAKQVDAELIAELAVLAILRQFHFGEAKSEGIQVTDETNKHSVPLPPLPTNLPAPPAPPSS